MKYLIVGLGNIGPKYAFTRHNIGFMVLDRLAAQKGLSFEMDKLAFNTHYRYKGRKIHLIKPTTYMNLSGKALNYWMQKYKVPIDKVLVIVDDLALPLGKLRLKPKGSDGGHNGLKHIIETLGHQNYARLRFGIGNNFMRGAQVDYVLENFSDEELEALIDPIDQCISIIESFASNGLESTMNLFN